MVECHKASSETGTDTLLCYRWNRLLSPGYVEKSALSWTKRAACNGVITVLVFT